MDNQVHHTPGSDSKFLTLGPRLTFQRNHGNKENSYKPFLRDLGHQSLGRGLEKPPYISLRYKENQFGGWSWLRLSHKSQLYASLHNSDFSDMFMA